MYYIIKQNGSNRILVDSKGNELAIMTCDSFSEEFILQGLNWYQNELESIDKMLSDLSQQDVG